MPAQNQILSSDDIQLKKKRMLAQMLMNQKPQEAQMVGGQYIPPSTLATINSAISPVLAMKASQDADTAELSLNEKKRQQLVSALTGNLPKDSPLIPMLSNPATQEYGMKLGLEDYKNEGDIKKLTDPRYVEAQKTIREAGRPVTNVNVSTEKKYGEKFAENIAKSDSDLRDAASKSVSLAERSNQIKQVLASGNVATGLGADFKLGFGKAAAAAGIKGAEDFAANTEVLASGLAQNTLDAVKASGLGAGSGFSNADRDFLEKAVGGKINLEPKSIERLADLAHRAASQSAARWNKRIKEIPPEAIQGTGLSREEIKVPDLFGSQPARQPSKGSSTVKKWGDL